MQVDFTPAELVRAASALEASIRRMRDHCRKTDAEFGDMNNIYRDAIADHRSAHAKMLVALRAADYPMTDADVVGDPIDERI